jgi:hypothetical protein
MRDEKRLHRLLRVRGLQLDLRRAEETRALLAHSSTAELLTRIDRLTDSVTPGEGSHDGLSLAASAQLRNRLHVSRLEARSRLDNAEVVLAATRRATAEAKRDQNAIEKLVDRARDERALADMRKLADLPATPKKVARDLL